MYLTKEDSEILKNTDRLLRALAKRDNLTKDEKAVITKFRNLRKKSEEHSLDCRRKAKALVQEKRKIDKSYAHTKKNKGAEC